MLPYILIVESDPKFVAKKDLVLHTPRGEVYIEEGSPVGLLKTEDGHIHLGKTGDVLEFSNDTLISDLLENCQPATFELAVDEEGDSSIKPTLLEGNILLEDKIARINIRESIPDYTLKVNKIRLY